MKMRISIALSILLLFVFASGLSAQTQKTDIASKPTIGVPDRIKRLVYLDALLPNDGESVNSIFGARDFIKQITKGDYIVPPWVKPDQPLPHDEPQPLKTFTEPVVLKNEAAKKIPATYILTVERGKEAAQDDFYSQSERAKQRGWPVLQLTSDHNPQWSAPESLVEMLASIK